MREIPKSLYQYRPIAGGRLGHLKSLLLHRELYLSSASRFNDPFDAKVDIDFSGAKPQDWRRIFGRGLKRVRSDLSYSKRKVEVTKIMMRKLYEDPARLQAVIDEVQSHMNRVGVTCFSEVPDSILMWSHYAESHTGVCVEFDHADRKSVIAKALPVKYSSTYAPVKAFEDSHERQVELFLLTKSDCWSYEREWRICDFHGGVGVQKLPENAIRSIRLGCRIDSSAKEAILSWVRQLSTPLLVLQAKKSSTQYALDFEAIVDNL